MEREVLLVALAAYGAATWAAARSFRRGEPTGGRFAALLSAALAIHALSIGLRWTRLGHGPFVTLHEILSSNLWSLVLVYFVAWWAVPVIRGATVLAMPVPVLMGAWLVTSNPAPGHMPPTYATVLLWVHVGAGKLFLGTMLAALSLAFAVLLRGAGRALVLPEDPTLAGWIRRLLGVAFVFHTSMLVLGAMWAQDAWGRYWGWDPLETWSFLTWVTLGLSLHVRAEAARRPTLLAGLTVLVFVAAFLTFFGVPFVSTAPHRGAV